jgi:predicted RNA-binding protein Jag
MNNDTEAAIQYAKKYLEDLLSFFGLNTDVYATTEDDEVIELNIPSTHLNGFLIGQPVSPLLFILCDVYIHATNGVVLVFERTTDKEL